MDWDEGKGKRKCWSIPTYHIELLLQFFIGIVDTELFKAVDFKCLKSKNKQIIKITSAVGKKKLNDPVILNCLPPVTFIALFQAEITSIKQ